jgi:hypothetical protein
MPIRRRVAVALLSTTLAAVVLAGTPPVANSDEVATSTSAPPAVAGVPGFFYAPELWDQVASSRTSVGDVVLSPNSGPGTSADPVWQDRRAVLQRAGQRVIGFVSYSIGGVSRNTAAITTDADRWRTWYAADGLYLDGTPTDCAHAPAVSTLVATLRAQNPGIRLIANSYALPQPCIADHFDTVVAFSGTAAEYMGASFPAWVANHPPSKFWHQIHTVAAANLTATAELARTRGAGQITLATNAAGVYPWSTLPNAPDWATSLSAITGTPFVPRPVELFPTLQTQHIASVNYFDDPAAWQRSATLGTVSAFVVVNPASGPGTAADSNVQQRVTTSVRRGQRPVGYLHTLYGDRPIATVVADAIKYRDWYGISAVFLDEAAGTCDKATYYSDLVTSLRAAGISYVVSNPGMDVPSCYSFFDGIVNFEGSLSRYLTWRPSTWVTDHSPRKFWHLVYDAPGASLGNAVGHSKQRWGGVVFFTDDTLTTGDANPWSNYPSAAYLADLKALVERAAAGQTPVAPRPARSPAGSAAGSASQAPNVPTGSRSVAVIPATTAPPPPLAENGLVIEDWMDESYLSRLALPRTADGSADSTVSTPSSIAPAKVLGVTVQSSPGEATATTAPSRLGQRSTGGISGAVRRTAQAAANQGTTAD